MSWVRSSENIISATIREDWEITVIHLWSGALGQPSRSFLLCPLLFGILTPTIILYGRAGFEVLKAQMWHWRLRPCGRSPEPRSVNGVDAGRVSHYCLTDEVNFTAYAGS